ncbi:MAG: response regulator transcription factor [Dehalococcoidia bacterium]|nr:response regulator transcription factor [Dehalococcoidia bacterium]
MPNTILIVEDEPNLLAPLQYSLKEEGYATLVATDGENGLRMARTMAPDLIILDVMLPILDGFKVCEILRRESDVPVIMLTARSEEDDRVKGLKLGDDYVTKPFSMPELLARVRNLLRRAASSPTSEFAERSEIIRSEDLTIDQISHSVTLGDKTLEMKPREFSLLTLLASNKGRAFTRNQILERLWGHDYIGDSRTVDVHVRWLREKIELDPSKPHRIVTIRGLGYRFDG